MYRVGEIYIPDYNEVLRVLHPAPELNVDYGKDRLTVSRLLPFSGAMDDQPLSGLIRARHYEFRRFDIEVFFGKNVRAWECIDGD